jgi:hypothetical protein
MGRDELRDELMALLAAGGEAYRAAHDALERGEDWVLWDGQVSASNLADVYARREVHTRQCGIPTLGLAESVERLRDRGSGMIRMGCVGDSSSPWIFFLFVEPEARYLIGCTGVSQR